VDLRIGVPAATPEKLRLYDRFHEFQAESKGWSNRGPKEADEYAESFVDNPFTTEEWCYYVRGRLIGVGYVDALPLAMSAIYFYYDPDERDRGLGTYNVLRILASAADRGVPYLYLGYFVAGCRSLEYKARFQPNEVLQADGSWAAFRD
jgi:arginine-tRNA-protein transferase